MIVVVYRKSEQSTKKYMAVFENEKTPDRIINGHSRKPLLPHRYVIDEIGMGESFISIYKSKHKIKKHEIV
jgi:hypothetical protein